MGFALIFDFVLLALFLGFECWFALLCLFSLLPVMFSCFAGLVFGVNAPFIGLVVNACWVGGL